MTQSIYKDEIYKGAAEAAQKATIAIQRLISTDSRVILADVESFEKPVETDAKLLANRCIALYKENKVILSADIKIYEDNGIKDNAGVIIMFIDKSDTKKLSNLILGSVKSEDIRLTKGMEESALTEALNIIGNAYINVIAKVYKSTIMSMVPKIVDDLNFDKFITEMVNQSKEKLYVSFESELIITKHVIKIPFLLAVALAVTKGAKE